MGQAVALGLLLAGSLIALRRRGLNTRQSFDEFLLGEIGVLANLVQDVVKCSFGQFLVGRYSDAVMSFG